MFKKTTLAIGLFFAMISVSQAGLYLEPYVGYATGSLSHDALVTNQLYTADVTNPVYGGRVGYSLPALVVFGVDAQLGSGDWKITEPGATPATLDWSETNIGAFVGVNLLMFRAFAEYIFSASGDLKSTSSTTEISGSGYKLGVGFTGLPFVSLNVEYKSLTLDEEKSGGTTTKLDDGHSLDSFLFTVGVPFDI